MLLGKKMASNWMKINTPFNWTSFCWSTQWKLNSEVMNCMIWSNLKIISKLRLVWHRGTIMSDCIWIKQTINSVLAHHCHKTIDLQWRHSEFILGTMSNRNWIWKIIMPMLWVCCLPLKEIYLKLWIWPLVPLKLI